MGAGEIGRLCLAQFLLGGVVSEHRQCLGATRNVHVANAKIPHGEISHFQSMMLHRSALCDYIDLS